jgi:hypothetical protein
VARVSGSLLDQAVAKAKADAKRHGQVDATVAGDAGTVSGDVGLTAAGPTWAARVWAKVTAAKDAKPDTSYGATFTKRWFLGQPTGGGMWGFRVAPTLVAEALRQLMFLAIGFKFIEWTSEQQGLVLSFVSALLAFFVSQNVTTNKTIERAGTTPEEVHKVAQNPDQVMTVQNLR